MAYETKVILALLADKAVHAKSICEIYNAIRKAANVEGLQLPTYEDAKKEVEKEAEYEREAK